MKRLQWDNLAPIIALDEGDPNIPKNIQLLRVGTFYHPKYGKFEVTKEHLLSMVKNFSDNVRKLDIAIDYSHENEKKAAGWIVDPYLQNNDTELWSEVKWTPAGSQVVSDREFRYTSSEFSLDYTDNESLNKFGPTLLGVGLTNRPAVKGMEPIIQLSEYKQNTKEYSMEELEKLKEENAMLKAELEKLKAKMEGNIELEGAKKELEEKEGMVKELSEKNENLEKENKKFKEEKELAEKETEFNVMLSEGKACEAQRESFIKGDFAEFTKNAQPVKLSSTGNPGKENKEEFKSAQDEVISLSQAKMKESGIDFDEAAGIVLSENPELNKKYLEEVKL